MKPPIKTEAFQSVESMQEQLERKPRGNSNNYPEAAAQQKKEALQTAIALQSELSSEVARRGRVDLNNLSEVKESSERFNEACKRAGVIPTFIGFSASMGYSRKAVYEYLRKNPQTPTASYIESMRTGWAAILAHMGLTRNASEPLTIFLLKNSGQGLQDRNELELFTRDSLPESDENVDYEKLFKQYAMTDADRQQRKKRKLGEENINE